MTSTKGKDMLDRQINHAPELVTYSYGVQEVQKSKHQFVAVRNQFGCLLSVPDACNLYVHGGNHASV